MIFASKKPLQRLAACVICLCVTTAHAFAYDTGNAIAAISPINATTAAESTARSVRQLDTAVQAVADAAAARAAEEAALAAAEEAARRALLAYHPVYGGTVQYSSARNASDVITTNGRPIGKYKLTFYCPCSSCSGGWGGGTSSGARASEGRTIAVDPRKIPIGSRVFIEGYGDFIAEDVGGAIKGNKIDIFLNSHSRCYQLGIQYANVYIMN